MKCKQSYQEFQHTIFIFIVRIQALLLLFCSSNLPRIMKNIRNTFICKACKYFCDQYYLLRALDCEHFTWIHKWICQVISEWMRKFIDISRSSFRHTNRVKSWVEAKFFWPILGVRKIILKKKPHFFNIITLINFFGLGKKNTWVRAGWPLIYWGSEVFLGWSYPICGKKVTFRLQVKVIFQL